MPPAESEDKKKQEVPDRESEATDRLQEVWQPPPDLEPLPSLTDEEPRETPSAVEPELIDLSIPGAGDEAGEEIEKEAEEAWEDEEYEGEEDEEEEYEDEEDLGEEEEEEEFAEDEEDESAEEAEEGEAAEEGAEAKGAKARKRRKRETPRVTDTAQAKAILECLLFAAIEPMSVSQIREYIHPIKPDELRGLIVELQNEYANRPGGLQIVEVAGGFQMATRPRYADWVTPLFRRKRRSGLSPAMLETLAIISYKQPIIRAELDAIRGVDSSGVVRGLQDMGLVDIVGQKQVPGRPNLYGTTQAFLKYFGLKSLSDLPSIDTLRKQFELTQG